VLYEHALTVAHNYLVLRLIAAQRVAIIERLWEPTALALAAGDTRLERMNKRENQARAAERRFTVLRDHLLLKYQSSLESDLELSGGMIPLHLHAFLSGNQERLEREARANPNARFHDEFYLKSREQNAAFEEGIRDLVRLERYARQAWSKQKRAMLQFMQMKLDRSLV
jgi:hypothetical protein